jgi:hypothetical protein
MSRSFLLAWVTVVSGCVGPLPAAEVVSQLEIVAVKVTPEAILDVGTNYPLQLMTLALDPGGVARGASYRYGLCPASVPLDGGVPNCLPPNGVELPAVGDFGDLDLFGALNGQFPDAGLPPSLDLTVEVDQDGEQALALKRVPLLPRYDYITAGALTVDGVLLTGDLPVQVSQGSHAFLVRPNCNDGYCEIAWYVTGGAPANQTNLLVDDNQWKPNTAFDWVAPPGPASVTVVAVVRSSTHAGGVDWTWGILTVSP